ncbi:putative myosin heavy chain fast skeletal muscle-like [Scophthalmus maximus]|uniref:Putative myosin heavy chain fast skeletal muscle-like n=1 Tax=Scophthalmus maximus TaxID=52904 RepID=A0A2U9BLM0_SCOMX|nr:putative myosin heavy chain fast skeletal muscle-like [Scophthalmus maximus]
MAGGSHFLWIPLVLSVLFKASDNRHVHHGVDTIISRTGNLEVDHILSKFPITLLEGIDPKNINVTSITLKTCTVYHTQLHIKMEQLLERFDNESFLILKIIPLTREVTTLQNRIKLTTNSTEAEIRVQQKRLQEKINNLNAMKQQIERSHSNSTLILLIISLQNQIWDLEEEESRRVESGLHWDERITALQKQLDRAISELRGEGDASSAMLELISVHSKTAAIQRHISFHIEKSRTNDADYQRQIRQKAELLKKKILHLNREESNTELTKEILNLQIEVEDLRRLRINAKSQTDSQLKELRGFLEEERKRQGNLQKQLEETEFVQSQLVMRLIGMMKELRELPKDEQQQTTSTSQAAIPAIGESVDDLTSSFQMTELQRMLQLKSDKCSGPNDRHAYVNSEFEQKIGELNRTGDSKAALILNMINLHEELKTLRVLISTTKHPERLLELQRQLQEKGVELTSRTADIERQIVNPQIVLSIIELQNEIWDLQKTSTNGTTTKRIKELQTRVDGLTDELINKGGENTKLILSIADLNTQLRQSQEEKQSKGQTASATIAELREQLKIKVEEHFRDRDEIKALENKINQTEAQCSSFEQKLKDLQNELDEKMKKLQSESDSVTSLALQVSTLTLQQEELKTQLRNTESKGKIRELLKQIEEKNIELAKKTEDLKARSSQPERFLQIIAIQTEIETFVNTPANDTDYSKIKALQDRLNSQIERIQDENNENTKLVFKVLSHQEEIARLKKHEESQSKVLLEKIKNLENELEDVRNQIIEKTLHLDSSDMRIINQSAQIMELHQKIKPLESEISNLKETNARNLAELQERMNVTKRQLQDSELRLQHADGKSFNLIMEIADLRAQLKGTRASEAAVKNNIEMEQQRFQTQQRENRRLENSNRDLKQEVNELKTCCNNDNARCEDLQRQLRQNLEDAERLEQQLQEMGAELKQLQQDSEEQTRESDKLLYKYLKLQDEYQKRQPQQSQDVVQNLQQQLLEKDATLKQLQQELQEQAADIYRLQEINKGLLDKQKDVDDRTIHSWKVTLDPNTANPRIALSADKTEMSTGEEVQNLPDHPGRFNVVLAALGETGFSSGRNYWEVSVAGKLCYHLGMASESAPRKGTIMFSPSNGFWTIVRNKQGQVRAIDKLPVTIPVQTQPLKLGILLDYKMGQVSFYDAGVRSHIYTFQSQTFRDKMYPFINFCVEDAEGQTPIVLITPRSADWMK